MRAELKGHRPYFKPALPAVVFLVCAMIAVVGLLFFSAIRWDQEAKHYSVEAIGALLTQAQDSTARELRSVIVNLNQQMDTRGLDPSMQPDAFAPYLQSMAEALWPNFLNPNDGLLFVSTTGGARLLLLNNALHPLRGITGNFARMAADALPLATSPSATPPSGILRMNGQYYIAAAFALTARRPISVSTTGKPTPLGTIVFLLRPLNEELLAVWAAGIHSGKISTAVQPNPGMFSLPLLDHGGETIGYLEWAYKHALLQNFARVYWPIVIILVLLLIFGLVTIQKIAAAVYAQEEYANLIADQKEQASKAAEFLTSTMDAIDEGVSVFDAYSRIRLWNHTYLRIWNMPEDMLLAPATLSNIVDWVTKNGFKMISPPGVTNPPVKLGTAGGVWHFEHPDGRIYEVRRLMMSHHQGFLSITRDLTKSRQYERALIEAREQAVIANRAKSEFLANISHELRTPLNAIIGFAEVLEGEIFGPIANLRYREYIKDIRTSGVHLLSLINDILDLSKIESGRFELKIEPVDVGDLVVDAIRLIRPAAAEGGVILEVEEPLRSFDAWLDARAAKQVILNLLSNAVKFTPRGGHVRLSYAPQSGGGVKLVIADEGIGIDEKDIATALAPFGQIDNSLSRRSPGTGLGLPIVKGIVKLHGGHMGIESVVNKGTIITIVIPGPKPGTGMGHPASLPTSA